MEYLKEELEALDPDCASVAAGLGYMLDYFNEHNQYDYRSDYRNIITFTREMGNAFPIYYDDMRKLLKEWLEETDEEAGRFDNDKVAATFDSLVERVLFKYFKLHKTIKNDFRGVAGSGSYLAVVGGVQNA